MYRIGLPLLLLTCTGQAWAADHPLDPSRLQQQIERHAGQANMTLPTPSREETPWLRESPQPRDMNVPHEADRGSRGYGQGYEQRYGASEGFSHGNGGFGSGGMSSGSGGRGHR